MFCEASHDMHQAESCIWMWHTYFGGYLDRFCTWDFQLNSQTMDLVSRFLFVYAKSTKVALILSQLHQGCCLDNSFYSYCN
jgi:hypothetical protein